MTIGWRRFKLTRSAGCVLAIMLLAYGLRVWLVMGGGQFYFPDEVRYIDATEIAQKLYEGEFEILPEALFKYEAHPGMSAIALAPASIHRLAYAIEQPRVASWGKYWSSRHGSYRFSALFFALPSTLATGLVYLLARRMGAEAAEAVTAAFLFAASNSMFLYSRHFLPYDFSLAAGLLALWLAHGSRGKAGRRALAVSLCAFMCFWIYHGYLHLYALIAAVFAALAGTRRVALWRLTGMALAAFTILGALTVYNQLALDTNLLAKMRGLARSITQGEFQEGAILPLLYFRDIEGGMALLWVAGLAAAGWRLRQAAGQDRRRGLLWLGCLLFLYLLMAFCSNVLQVFVVYGRTARQLTPFAVLLSAYGFAPWLGGGRWRMTVAFAVLASALAAANFLPAIRWTWYMEFVGQAQREYGAISCELTFAPDARFSRDACPRYNPDDRYRLFNAGYIYPITSQGERPAGKVLARFPHPLMQRGLRYESYTPEMRASIESEAVYVWLIDTMAEGE